MCHEYQNRLRKIRNKLKILLLDVWVQGNANITRLDYRKVRCEKKLVVWRKEKYILVRTEFLSEPRTKASEELYNSLNETFSLPARNAFQDQKSSQKIIKGIHGTKS
jgi:hypothetical protein